MDIQRKEISQREKQAQERLDDLISEQVDNSLAQADGNNPDPDQPPPWHLVIVRSDPVEYRLRAPYWSDSPFLESRSGYIYLTNGQLTNWKIGIMHAAIQQAHRIPPDYKNWVKPGGNLDKLLRSATVLERQAESRRDLYILGFVYRYLMRARPVIEHEENGNDGDNRRNGQLPVGQTGNSGLFQKEDGSILFKLDGLKKKVKESKEDFAHHEVMAVLENYSIQPAWHQHTRWWSVTREDIQRIGQITMQAEPLRCAQGNSSNGESVTTQPLS